MTYEKYLETIVARGYRVLEQSHCDSIVEALVGVGFSREEAYQRAMNATKARADRSREFVLRFEEVNTFGGMEEDNKIVATLLEKVVEAEPVSNTEPSEYRLMTVASQMGDCVKEALDRVLPYLEMSFHAGGLG